MDEVSHQAVARADALLVAALKTETRAERRRHARLARFITDPAAKMLGTVLIDRLFRCCTPARAADGLRDTLREFGVAAGFSVADRFSLRSAGAISAAAPAAVIHAMQHRLRRESTGVILPAEERRLAHYLERRRRSGARINLNLLGEAILGEGEAGRRFQGILALLARPDVDYISVKVSSICSQINLHAWGDTLRQITHRLRWLYRVAMPQRKIVNLDMEDFRDLALTLAAFRAVLDEPEFRAMHAGVVLQAYLPDSWDAQRQLTDWAKARVANGCAPIKLRIVKGANLAMETVESEMHGWPAATYATKAETDANFCRMIEFACRPENARAVRVGVGSHNLFDIALALTLRDRNGIDEFIEIEMLEGMANHQARAVQAAAGGILLYAPIVKHDDFGNALAYLIRRLDENTAPENFLHDIFCLAPGSPAWLKQKGRFLSAWVRRNQVGSSSRRATPPPRAAGFHNEPDSDWALAARREAVARAVAQWKPASPPGAGPIDGILDTARAAQPAWEARGDEKRGELLRRCADVMAAHRDESIACMRLDAKKAIWEADPEVSEAVDFARYYARQSAPAGVTVRARGVVVVAPPWNFPLAIPAGGVLAALMAGNAVVLKPSPETVATAWWLARQLWEAGIPRDVLQFLHCPDEPDGRKLICDPRVDAVVLTGAYDTARMFQEWRPSLPLFAETSGKNAIIVSALADHDLAIKDIVRSAFGHSGQKCSAASLAILEAEVYDDPAFRRQLRDAAASLRVGPATDPASVVVPLIRPPDEAMRRALTTLDPGEEWLLQPRQQTPADACLWSPGIRLGVKPGSWFHQTECFGPVLGLMRAKDLDDAIAMQNGAAYGLTAGLHTLDEREVARWRDRVQAGNLYVNRAITGAIVRRQPFGGWKRSCIGPGAKAGGPNYVNLFRRLDDARPAAPDTARASFAEAWRTHFSIGHDPSGLRCESNIFRYRPCRGVILRLSAPDETAETLAKMAAETCGVPLEISRASDQDDAAFVARLPQLAARAEFLRTVATPPDDLLRAAYAAGLNWINAPLSGTGRVELTRWLREQSVAMTLHRHGNIISKRPADEHDDAEDDRDGQQQVGAAHG